MTQAKPLPKTGKNITIESLNVLTHGIATILSVIGLVLLVQKGLESRSVEAIVAYIIFGMSMILLFLNSSIYHSVSFTKYKGLFQKLDHSAIYLLISGSYTPYLMIAVGGTFGYVMLAFIWVLGLVGIYFEVRYTDRFPKLSTFMYLGLGWIGIIMIYPLFQAVDIMALVLLALGGLAYSIGTVFYSMKHNRWMHVVWHLFVMGGAGFIFASIYLYI